MQILNYDKDSGVFSWRNPNSNRVKKDDSPGSIDWKGYLIITIDSRRYRAHRLAWVYTYGEMPKYQIDHINQDKLDNRISNLREVTNLENHKNMPARKDNKSGYTGVHFDRVKNRWVSFIYDNKKRVHLGTFKNKLDAIDKRKCAEVEYGYHENHGRKDNQ